MQYLKLKAWRRKMFNAIEAIMLIKWREEVKKWEKWRKHKHKTFARFENWNGGAKPSALKISGQWKRWRSLPSAQRKPAGGTMLIAGWRWRNGLALAASASNLQQRNAKASRWNSENNDSIEIRLKKANGIEEIWNIEEMKPQAWREISYETRKKCFGYESSIFINVKMKKLKWKLKEKTLATWKMAKWRRLKAPKTPEAKSKAAAMWRKRKRRKRKMKAALRWKRVADERKCGVKNEEASRKMMKISMKSMK